MGGVKAGDDGPDEDQTGRDLHKRGGEGRADETEEDMEDLERGEGLHGGEQGPGARIRGGHRQERGELGRERVGGGVGRGRAGGEGGEGGDEHDRPARRRDDVERDQIHANIT